MTISATAFSKRLRKSVTVRSRVCGLSSAYFSPKKAHMVLRCSTARSSVAEAVLSASVAVSLKFTITSRKRSFWEEPSSRGTAAFRISSSTCRNNKQTLA
eukprot:639987-Pyramimonas_sp.AAC.1